MCILFGMNNENADPKIKKSKVDQGPDGKSRDGKSLEDKSSGGKSSETQTILIVDDDSDWHEYFELLLSEVQHKKALHAKSGHEALYLLQEFGSEIGLIICDYQMPHGNGVWLAEQLQHSSIPIVLVTNASIEKEYYELFDYISLKPLQDDDLWVLQKLLERASSQQKQRRA